MRLPRTWHPPAAVLTPRWQDEAVMEDEAPPTPSVLPARIAAHGLPGTPATPAHGLLGDGEFEELLAQCEQHRLLGLIGVAVRDGALAVTAGQHDRVEEHLEAWLAHALRVERLLVDATTALDAAGLEHRVLKGVALAHLAYPDPAWRVFGDVDLLVPGASLTAAVRVLEPALGLSRVEAELRPGFDDRFGKEALLQAPGGPELDLHRTFAQGALGLTVELEDLFVPGQPFTLGGHRLQALPPSQQLIHAAYAAVMGDWPPRLAAVRDVAQILLTLDPPFDEVLRFARRWRAEGVLARGVMMAWDVLAPSATPPLVTWASSYRLPRLDRLLLAAQTGAGRGYDPSPGGPGRHPWPLRPRRLPTSGRLAPSRLPAQPRAGPT